MAPDCPRLRERHQATPATAAATTISERLIHHIAIATSRSPL
ncbi:hypothetical protein ACFPRL_31270 [Pseudoclavibacter helvolus]